MTTPIQNNQPSHQCCPTTQNDQKVQQQQVPDTSTQNNWQGASTGDATKNNPFAGQVLAQQTNGPMTTTTTANQHVDMDGNGLSEASLTSAFDESGNVRSNAYTMDNSGDGVVDYGEAYTYDREGKVTGHVVVQDTDLNGTMDTQSHATDRNGNGTLDTKTTVVYDDDGNLTSRSVAQDVNEDGIMDFAFNETFDAEGNRTSYGTTIFEDGMFGSNTVPDCVCPEPAPAPEEPEVIISSPSAGGTSTEGEATPAGPVNTTAAAEFVSESAGYNNALYTYDLDDAGNPTNIRQVIDNSNAMSAGASLGDVSMTDGKPNLLLLPNGSNNVDENSQLTIVDGKLHVDGQEYSGDAYFSHSAEMSTDGKQHFQMTTDDNGNTTIQMEDLRNLGDNDFNDLVIKVSATQDFEGYVSNHADLEKAWNDMSQLGTVSSAHNGEYKEAYGTGLNEQDFVNAWNAVEGRRQITDIGDLTKAEWGMLHYETWGKNEGRSVPAAVPSEASSAGSAPGSAPSAGGTSTGSTSGATTTSETGSTGETSSAENTSTETEPQPVITGEVEIFEHASFEGKKSTLGLGYYSHSDIQGMGLNDKTSSLKVPEGMVLVAYEHDNKRGEQFVYTSDSSWVGSGANDKFSSFEVMTEAEYNAKQSKTVQVYEHSQYKGDVASLTLEGDYKYFSHADINALGMNDKASSIKVPDGMVLVAYEHDNKRGEKTVYDANSSWVGSGVNDKFSSFELMTEEEYAKRSSKTVELFEHSNYNGDVASLTLQGDYQYFSHAQINALGMNDKTSSIKVPEGMVLVAYEHDNKRGEKTVYDANSSWVGGGANDKFSSFELMTEEEYAARNSKTVELFEHSNYSGDVASFTLSGNYQYISHSQINALGMNDKTSSLKVPEGMVVVAYEHDNKGGNKSVYTANSNWVGSGVNDKFSSLEIMTQAEYDARFGNKVEVFEHSSYGGQSASLAAGFYDVQALKNMGLHDKISSIKVPEGMVLVTWEHGNKGGSRNVYREGDTSYVGGGNNDNISNMEIMTEEEYIRRINNGGL